MAVYGFDVRAAFWPMVPVLGLFIALLALPYLVNYALWHVADAFYREVLAAAVERFDTFYFGYLGVLSALVLFAMLEHATPLPRKFAVFGLAAVAALSTLVVPTAGYATQASIKEAALLCRERQLEPVMWRLNAPSFSVYRGAPTPSRELFLALNRIGPATSDVLWANITVLGDGMVAFALCLPLWRRRPDLLWALAFVALLGTLWVHGMKPFVDVARPPAVLGDQVHIIGRAYKAHSFPSGHATTAFAIGGLLALGLTSRLWAGAIVALAVVVAASRAVVGVHWPLDILAGAFGGWLAAVCALWLAKRTWRFGERPLV